MKIAILHQTGQDGADQICSLLVPAGHDCVSFESARVFLDQLQPGGCDLLVIDAQMPGLNVPEVVRAAKIGAGDALPVLLLTDGAEKDAIIAALAVGVGDYLLKPVRRSELLARVSILLCRAWPDSRASAQMQIGPFVFDTMAGSVSVNGKRIRLTQKEFDLALLFFRHLGQPLSRVTLQETLWSQDGDTPSRTVDTHVSRVRSKLCLQASMGFRLVPVYAYGYLLERVDGGE
jgi:DNA-binding response OmpR family regulator